MLIPGNSFNSLEPNTPAGDYWSFYLAFTLRNMSEVERKIPISFLPTGEIDMTHTSNENLVFANNLLAPTIQILRAITDNSFDLWRFMNWMFVGFYWGLLADLRQIAPTAYKINDELFA